MILSSRPAGPLEYEILALILEYHPELAGHPIVSVNLDCASLELHVTIDMQGVDVTILL